MRFPRESAYQAIRELEEFDRGYFTGMVGWCDARGNGEWVVTIRCAEVGSHQMKLLLAQGLSISRYHKVNCKRRARR